MMSVRELIRVFGPIGLLSFGGPAAQIALMHKELVEDRPWMTEDQFLRALSFCMLLPGPEAMQLATFAGWQKRGTLGALIAGLLFVVPGALVITGLALAYAQFGALPFVQALFLGIKATVLVIVLQALWKVSHKALTSRLAWVLAGLAFIGLFAFDLPFPLLILSAGLVGWFGAPNAASADLSPPKDVKTIQTVTVWLVLWLAPVAILAVLNPGFLSEIARFFSVLAVVTFGGAYAVLAYMTQTVVQDFGWLSTPEMMDALGLAETTPGPLILVTQFVAMLAGFKAGGIMLSLAAGATALWVTFAPCFLWIFAGAPYVEWLSSQSKVAGALRAITAAVVGVILNLSLWFFLHVSFATLHLAEFGPLKVIWPDLTSVNWVVLALTGVAAYLLIWRKWPLPVTLGLMALLGAASNLV
ncbi:MAG: chromate efflux transporter [Pseudomonadota bacterium]